MPAKYLRIICPRCKNKQIIYSRATLRIKCDLCNRLLIQPTGGKTKVKAGVKQIIKVGSWTPRSRGNTSLDDAQGQKSLTTRWRL